MIVLQSYVDTFIANEDLNNKVAEIEACKYCTVKDIRIIPWESDAVIRAQILYDYDISLYNEDHKK